MLDELQAINPKRQRLGEDDDSHSLSAVVTATEHGVPRICFLQQTFHCFRVSEDIAVEDLHLPRSQVLQVQKVSQAQSS